MKISLTPERDSANTAPPEVEFVDSGEFVRIELDSPQRTIVFSKEDLRRALNFLCPVKY